MYPPPRHRKTDWQKARKTNPNYVHLYNCVSVCERESRIFIKEHFLSGISFGLTVISPSLNPKRVIKKKTRNGNWFIKVEP